MTSTKLAAYRLGIALTGVAIIISLYFYTTHSRHSHEVSVPSVVKAVRFVYTLNNRSDTFIDAFDFIAYSPIDSEHYQVVKSIDATQEFQVSGNGTVNNVGMRVSNLPPYGSRVVSLTMEVAVFDGPKSESIDKALYLKPETYIELDDPLVARLASRFSGGTEEVAESIFRWVRDNITDAGYIAQNRGAKYAIENKRGDCTEFMYAFIALARANGIPARGVAGFVVEEGGALVRSSDYHNWAEFHDGNRWRLVDPYKGVFDDKYADYIAFRFIGSGEPSLESARRFLAVDERVSVRL